MVWTVRKPDSLPPHITHIHIKPLPSPTYTSNQAFSVLILSDNACEFPKHWLDEHAGRPPRPPVSQLQKVKAIMLILYGDTAPATGMGPCICMVSPFQSSCTQEIALFFIFYTSFDSCHTTRLVQVDGLQAPPPTPKKIMLLCQGKTCIMKKTPTVSPCNLDPHSTRESK